MDADLVSRSVRVEAPPFRAVVDAATSPRTVWAAPGEATVVGSGAAAALTATGGDRFAAIREAAADLFASGDVHAGTLAARPRLFGGFAFHEEHDRHDGEPPWDEYPSAGFLLPRVQLTYTGTDPTTGDPDAGSEAWLTVTAVGPDASAEAVETRLDEARETVESLPAPGPVAEPPGVADRRRTTDRDAWRESVNAALARIEAGDLRKVVLAQALEADLERPLDLPDTLARLAERYPDCYRFLLEPIHQDDGTADSAADTPRPGFFGATPERLVDLTGRTVETGALAGTTGRGETPAEDEWLAEELLHDDKNVHEHELVADAIRDQLAPYAASVAAGKRRIRRLATVQHIETPITAELAADHHVLDLVEALHPTPAVGGLPPDRALQTIRDTEPFDRGWYAAPVGWFDAAGYGSFAVAIRSAVASPDDEQVTMFAGVGLVADSNPDREWDEVQLKYRPILDELE
ncbi:isochorismate synthase [Haloglomus litoreum]|uniref:isochorismate synthase n=1 Tax=Haloglomus litoreum TaxID=3034026 RepID=UPI0023E82585|nr:isochorismate synthase [Haloglomus sp. DT116]